MVDDQDFSLAGIGFCLDVIGFCLVLRFMPRPRVQGGCLCLAWLLCSLFLERWKFSEQSSCLQEVRMYVGYGSVCYLVNWRACVGGVYGVWCGSTCCVCVAWSTGPLALQDSHFLASRFVFALFGGRVCLFVALCFPFLGWFSGPLALQAHVCARVEVVFAAPCSCARVCFLRLTHCRVFSCLLVLRFGGDVSLSITASGHGYLLFQINRVLGF